MYKELFDRNKEAIVFLKEQENLTDSEVNSIAPIRHTKLNSKTIVGIADLMTRFAEKQANGAETRTKPVLPIQNVTISQKLQGRVLGDFEIWYEKCKHCGYDTGKSRKLEYARCWKCGRPIKRDYSERALKAEFK